jgi:tRNA(fMet)-specific endonuclease VapC
LGGEEKMKVSLIDTNILSLFFRGQPQVVANFEAYLQTYATIRFSIITYYEIVSGLKHRDAHNQLSFQKHFDRISQLQVKNWAEDV